MRFKKTREGRGPRSMAFFKSISDWRSEELARLEEREAEPNRKYVSGWINLGDGCRQKSIAGAE